jgi:hypothetical protein
LTCPDDVNQWFWGGHLAHVSHAWPVRVRVRVTRSDLWLWGMTTVH